MTTVMLRHAEDGRGQRLADIPFDELDSVIPTIKGWGLADLDDSELSGQFVYGEGGAYFEVVIEPNA